MWLRVPTGILDHYISMFSSFEWVFLLAMQTLLGTKATNRKVTEMADKHALREQSAPYNTVLATENSDLTLDDRLFGNDL